MKVSMLQERPCDEQAAPLPVGELPACLPQKLGVTLGHAVDEAVEAQLVTHLHGLR